MMSKLKKLNNEQTAYFCEQLWLMINAGMQLDDGLDILAEDIDDNNLRAVCSFLSEQICDGKPLHTAMKFCGAFPSYAVSMTEIGGMSGRLDDVLKGLSEYYENRADMQHTVRYSVFHPAMLLVMMAVVTVVLVVRIIPMFSEIFASFDTNVGAAVSDSVGAAQLVGNILLIVLLVIIVLTALIVLVAPVRRAVYSFFAVFPLTSRICRSFALSKLTDAMCMMITAGISPEEALEYALTLISDKRLRGCINDCLRRIRGGEYFADAIGASGMLPKSYARSLKIAYTSGSFDVVWRKISRRTSDEAQNNAARLISLIEPAMVVVLAVMIGSVLLTVMLPLMNIMSALG